MDPARLSGLLAPLVQNEADYTKGNRFRDFKALKKMPLIRRIGNLGLGFCIKGASGYWNVFDPNNGYFKSASRLFRTTDAGASWNEILHNSEVNFRFDNCDFKDINTGWLTHM